MISFLRRTEEKPREPIAKMLARELCRPRRVLLVDDNEHLCDFLRKYAEYTFRVEVVMAGSLAEADELLARDHDFELAILDYRLTNGSGVRLYRDIADMWPEMRVVFLTGYDSEDLRAKVHAIGPAHVLTKDEISNPRFLAQLFCQIGVPRRETADA